MKNPRHHVCPTDGDPPPRVLICRDGDLLTSLLAGVLVDLEEEEMERLREEGIECGSGIERVDNKLEWRAHVPGFGYLELTESGVPQVVPAVTVTPDHLVAYLDLRAPAGDEPAIQLAEIYQAIREAGIVHGFSTGHVQAAWRMFQATGQLPCPIRIATGTRPQEGREPDLKWEIDVEQHVGKINPDQGRIDFYERHFVPNVRAGQRLATWHLGAERVSGQGVDGVEISSDVQGAVADVKVGENIVVREEPGGTVVLDAAVDGMLVFDENGVPRVSDTLDVPGDISLETGNVDAMGSIVVHGAIRSELRVTATGGLKVHGVVEAADVEIEGNIVVDAGIVGDEDSLVVAGGDITFRHSQNARIRCGGNVRILDSDMNSRIECKGTLTATEGRGRLRGGTYLAGTTITVREAGSVLGAPTVLAVGTEGKAELEIRAVRRALRDVRARLRLCRRQEPPFCRKMEGPGGTATLRRRPKVNRELTCRENALRLKLNRLEGKYGGNDQCSVTVLSQVHHGVEIVVCGKRHRVKWETSGRRFFIDPYTREIEVQPL